MEMFFNFAYIDQGYLGEDKTSELYQLSAHLDMCASEHVFTIFSWLQAVYEGKKEPSKNEFDMDYTAYLTDGLRRGEWTKDEIERMKLDQKAKAKYELENMFVSVNRVTYGNITMFSPLLTEKDLFNSLDKMLVTAERLEDAFNAVRKVDYSLFYRPMFPQQTTGDLLKNEMIMKEILPDVIPVNFGGYVAEANDAITTALADLFAGKTDIDGALAEADAQLRNQLGR